MPQPTLTLVVRLALAAAVALATPPAPMRAQAAADQAVTLEAPGIHATGTIRMPSAPARPPVVLLASTADQALLATSLAGHGIASLRLDAPISEDSASQWISWLRNDDRFPTVSVFSEGAPLLPAVVAARAARADGVITRGDPGAAGAEIARLRVPVSQIETASADADAAGIAAFARTVPALGRRGTRETRSAGARRSPRHTIIASVNGVRVGVEWGQPQKRGRDIWGVLVRWNAVWMPGADEATVLTTNGPIAIGTVDVPAGDHTFYTLPAADRFQLLVSRDVGQFHTVYESSLVLGRTDMSVTTRPDVVEGLTFAIAPRGSAATLKLIWDTREYSAAVTAK